MDNQPIYFTGNSPLPWYDDRVNTVSSVTRNTNSNVDGTYDTLKTIYGYLDSRAW